MTNLEVIKYIVNNDPSRLLEFLEDLWCYAWNAGSYAVASGDVDKYYIEFTEDWLNKDALENGFFDMLEIENWSKNVPAKGDYYKLTGEFIK